MSNGIIGRCSICGGDVYRPQVTYAGEGPRGQCTQCGQREARGPIIDMGNLNRGGLSLNDQQSLMNMGNASRHCVNFDNQSWKMQPSTIERILYGESSLAPEMKP